MDEISVASFAKINWVLKVLGKRSDGYHQIATVLQTVDLRDELQFQTAPWPETSLELQGRAVAPGSDNLLVKTAAALRSQTGVRRGVRMRLVKRIPVGAGLGGGSGNAAIALLALNRLWDLRLGGGELLEVAAGLGSDVPFFLGGGTAAGTGRGEILKRLPEPPPVDLLLLYPGFEISAGEAYGDGGWGPLEEGEELTNRRAERTIRRFRRAVGGRLGAVAVAENDFDGPLFSRHPRLAKARDGMMRAGCERVMLCGSGSTLLGLARRGELAAVAEAVSGEGLGEAMVCRTLSSERYREILGQSNLTTVF